MKTYYIVSGGFDPIHKGHIAMIKASAQASDGVIVLVNSDDWLVRKKGKYFQNFYTRKTICENLKGVIMALGFDDTDNSAGDGIRKVRALFPNEHLVFANGGDRGKDNIREDDVCIECHVDKVFGVGGDNKANSSSWILGKWNTREKENENKNDT
jgi:cytidyltransferase-like protein